MPERAFSHAYCLRPLCRPHSPRMAGAGFAGEGSRGFSRQCLPVEFRPSGRTPRSANVALHPRQWCRTVHRAEGSTKRRQQEEEVPEADMDRSLTQTLPPRRYPAEKEGGVCNVRQETRRQAPRPRRGMVRSVTAPERQQRNARHSPPAGGQCWWHSEQPAAMK